MKLSELITTITPRGNFKLANVTIVGPYPTKNFFKDQLSKTKPDAVRLYVDDGWPEDKVAAIEYYVKRYTKINYQCRRVNHKNKGGLVHAKIYLFEWINEGNRHRRRHLALGSHNASQAGFGQNAEALITIDLSSAASLDSEHKILGYFNDLNENGVCDSTLIELNKGSYISLPALEITQNQAVSGFDAWLRRGSLCHKYVQDASFGRLPIRLKQPFPIADIESIFASYQFGKVGESTALFRPYINYTASTEQGESPASKRWKGQFFIETDYGFWTSSECFEKFQEQFVDSASESRQVALNRIRSSTDFDRQRWVTEHIEALNAILEKLRDQGEPVEMYLKMDDYWLNERHYRESAISKLELDFKKSCDEDFSKRFVSGFSFPSVPHLEDGFDSFAENFCITLLLKAQQKKRINKLANAVRTALGGSIDEILTGWDLLNELRIRWPDIASQMMYFHEE